MALLLSVFLSISIGCVLISFLITYFTHSNTTLLKVNARKYLLQSSASIPEKSASIAAPWLQNNEHGTLDLGPFGLAHFALMHGFTTTNLDICRFQYRHLPQFPWGLRFALSELPLKIFLSFLWVDEPRLLSSQPFCLEVP